MATMKLSRFFYTGVLTGAWILCTILTLQFPAAEGLTLLFVLLAGVWALLFGGHSPAEVFYAYTAASVITVLLMALSMDRVGVPRRTWLRSTAACAGLLGLLIAFFYFREALNESSFSGAAGKFNFDRPAAVMGYLLFCVSGGLLLGSLCALGITWLQRIFGRPNPILASENR